MSWSKEKALALIREVGLVPIVRAPSPDDALRAAEAIISGGIGIAEITMTVPNALRVLEMMSERFGDKVLLGAGTVLDAETCKKAVASGAQFIVTPSLELAVIEEARRQNKPCIPGALSPTEVLAAWRAGADMVSLSRSQYPERRSTRLTARRCPASWARGAGSAPPSPARLPCACRAP